MYCVRFVHGRDSVFARVSVYASPVNDPDLLKYANFFCGESHLDLAVFCVKYHSLPAGVVHFFCLRFQAHTNRQLCLKGRACFSISFSWLMPCMRLPAPAWMKMVFLVVIQFASTCGAAVRFGLPPSQLNGLGADQQHNALHGLLLISYCDLLLSIYSRATPTGFCSAELQLETTCGRAHLAAFRCIVPISSLDHLVSSLSPRHSLNS